MAPFVIIGLTEKWTKIGLARTKKTLDQTIVLDPSSAGITRERLRKLLEDEPDLRDAEWCVCLPTGGRSVDETESGRDPSIVVSWLRDHDLEFRLADPAECAARAEFIYGAGRDVDHLMLLKIGSRIGGTFITSGQLYMEGRGRAEGFGHLVIEPDGRLCECGNTGCLQMYGSTVGLKKTYRSLAGEDRGVRDIIDRVHKDPLAYEAAVQTGLYLGRGLAQFLNIFDPLKVVITGTLSESFHVLEPWITRSRDHHVTNDDSRFIPIVRGELNEPVLRGGLALMSGQPM